MAKILLTGGLGFIGHELYRQLSNLHGLDVVSIDTETNYGVLNQKELDNVLHLRKNVIKNLTNHLIDVRSNIEVDVLFSKELPDTVIHLASFPRQKVVNLSPKVGSEVMIGGLINLLESAVNSKIKKFVYVSSSMVYGNFSTPVKEDHLCKPIGQYAIYKLTGEQLVKFYAKKHNFDYVIVRPSAVYGPLDVKDRVISKFFYAATQGNDLVVNGKNEKCDFTYIHDTVDGIVRAVLNPLAVNKVFNISKSDAIPILEAAEKIVSLVGRGNIKIQNKDMQYPSRVNLDIEHANKILKYSPQINLDQGLKLYYEWIENNFDSLFVN